MKAHPGVCAMPKAVRFNDMASDHDAAVATTGLKASPNVNIDGMPAMCEGGAYAPHACPNQADHQRSLAGGSLSVFINGKPVGREGDPISCGGKVADGSATVSIGD